MRLQTKLNQTIFSTMKKAIKKLFKYLGLDIRKSNSEPESFYFLEHLGTDVVIDIGANVGLFSEEIRMKLPNATIYAFEPLKECFNVLSEKFKLDKNFNAFNIALGSHKGDASMHKNEYTPCSSILPITDIHKKEFPHAISESSEKVSVGTLDDVIGGADIAGKVILIKMDVQGYELEVLKGATQVLDKSKAVLAETCFTSLYDGQPLFQDIYKYLTERGFVYKGSIQQKLSKIDGMVIAQDSLFLKP